jgi:hypothetical protein
MNAVNVAELFQALEAASRSSVVYTTGYMDYGAGGPQRRQVQQASVLYGFRTQGPLDDSSIWSFYHEKPALIEDVKTCRFWQLEPYLATYKIDDIITAVQTGYKLLGEPAPTINFHKDTKLLIAVGGSSKLSLIDAVLKELPARPAAPSSGFSPPPQPAANPEKARN